MTLKADNLLPGEVSVMASDDGALTLTTKRVKYEAISQSKSVYKSVPIDQVSACTLDTQTFPILLVLAVVAALVVFVAPEAEARIIAGIITVVLILAYFVSRNGQIRIFSNSGESIAVPIKGISHDQARKFLEAIEMRYQEVKLDQRSQPSRAAA